ncbi:GlcNAc transferase [Cavenderia fasciculata]|uniref:protein xylosyltransferase n=1 Tax=Cavenderia fasciculata TaxID=261658 RepID=F4PJN9_CACFS|nr:GlcNAc transferase [Cavenderia fasciculata]EGG23813.1 GlcNAc transferase [Cavenderia fasciculata]|eukprot:XP_004361664.1 GlcNAc transferase [Cavenderia fasciculata]
MGNHTLKNIQFVENRLLGIWGAPSMVYMELAGYAKLFDMVSERQSVNGNEINQMWSHVINLSTNDMPLKPLSKIEEFFCDHFNTTYMCKGRYLDNERFNGYYMEFVKGDYWSKVGDGTYNSYDCGKPGNLKYFSPVSIGTQWHMLTSGFAHHLISDIKSLETLMSLKFSYIPDESFYQAAWRTYSQDDFESNYHRDTMWDKVTTSQHSRYSVDLEDLDTIPKHLMFIRKVYTNQVKEAIISKFLTV